MLLNLLDKNVAEYPENIAIEFGSYKISYQKLDEIINKLANGLEQLSIKHGDRVVVLLPNTPHFVFAYYALLKIGSIIVPLNPLLKTDEYRSILMDIEPAAIIVWDIFYKQHSILFKEYNNVIILGNVNNKQMSLTNLIASASSDKVNVTVNKYDTAVIVYPAGVVSSPKAVELSYENISASSIKFTELFSTDRNDRFGGILPFFLIYAQNMIMNPALLRGATFVLYSKFDMETIKNVLSHDNITFLAGSASIFEMFLSNTQDMINKLSLKYALSIGNVCPPKVLVQFEEKFKVPILEGYGVVEAAGMISCNRDLPDRKMGSSGLTLNGVDIKVVDEDGLDLSPGEIGEIVVSGINVMKGYWKQAEKTNSVLRDGWYFTGDLGKIDEEGFLYFIDRKADVILKGGFHIYPGEIEIILKEHPKIDQVCVIGIQHSAHGQEVKACIVLKEGENAIVEEIVEFCKEKTPVYKCPQIVQFYKSLPRSSTGKILRRKLYEQT